MATEKREFQSANGETLAARFDRPDGKTKARVEIWVKEDTKIPEDSQLTINQLGLLGEKYVEIIPGLETRRFLASGDVTWSSIVCGSRPCQGV